MGKVNFGVIGCGGIASYFHLPDLKMIPEARVSAVADVDPVRARMAAERFDVRSWCTEYGELLQRDDVDAVIIATPHPTHAKIAIDALDAGKHVLIQKPMATKIEDADKIVEATNRHSDLKVMVLPFVYLDTPHFDYAKDLLKKRKLGKVCMARSRVAHIGPEGYQKDVARIFRQESSCWFFELKKAHGGVLYDLGVYAISQLTYLLGPAKEVSAFMATLDKPAEVEDNAALILRMRNEELAVVETSWTEVAKMEGTALYGTEGTLLLNYFNNLVTYYTKKSSSWIMPQLAKSKEEQHTHKHFVRSISKDLRPIGSVEEGRHVVEIMEGAYRAKETGKTIKLRTSF